MSSRNYTVKQDKVNEADQYPLHVKAKLKAYENAGLQYIINNDSIMKRSIIFELKKQMRPDTYRKRIDRIFRLRDPIAGKEFIVYDTYEKVMGDGNQPYEDNIRYGLDELIEADPTFDDSTGAMVDKKMTRHDNVYTIPYDKKILQNIFMSQADRDNTPDMYLADTSKSIDALYLGKLAKIENRNNFTIMPYNELMLMSLTHTSTIDDALIAAKVVREEKSLLPDQSDKLSILQYAKNLQGQTTGSQVKADVK